MVPMVAVVAEFEPQIAEKPAQAAIVVPARPPGRRRVQRCTASNSFSAMPERSSMVPMNTNSGTAARTKLEAMSSIFSITWKITAPLNTR